MILRLSSFFWFFGFLPLQDQFMQAVYSTSATTVNG